MRSVSISRARAAQTLRPLIAVLGMLVLHGCGRPTANQWYEEQRLLYYGIPVRVSFAPADQALADRVWAYLTSVDKVFNDYHEDSEIGQLNATRGPARVALSSDLAEAFAKAVELQKLTGGAFDVTVGPLRRLWRGAEQQGQPPSPAAVQEALTQCGPDRYRLVGGCLELAEGTTEFDFGGLIKGMAADRVTAMLREAGCRASLVQVGGETAAFGTSRRGRSHVIGIQHPRDMNALWTAIADPGTGLSCGTSGNYRNAIVIGGVPYYHIFDPKTGKPVDTHTLSVTVAFPQTGKNWLADGLSTAGAVLGPDATLELVTEAGGEALILVQAADGGVKVVQSPGWERLVFEP